MTSLFRSVAAAVALLVAASPALAQWTPVSEVPAANIYSVWIDGSTITAGSDSTVHVSVDGGVVWKGSATVAAGVTSVQGARVRNGRLYAGTYGQGVFVSDDLGDTWLSYNQGLVGGIFNTQLFVVDMLVRGDSLYLATSGDGPWVRNLVSGTWTHFSDIFEPNQASNMNAIAASPARLFACAGFNGTVFYRDDNQADWTLSWLNNTGIAAGLGSLAAVWTGSAWVVGTNVGVFHSPQGQSPWTPVDLGLGTLFSAAFAVRGGDWRSQVALSESPEIAWKRRPPSANDAPASWERGAHGVESSLMAAAIRRSQDEMAPRCCCCDLVAGLVFRGGWRGGYRPAGARHGYRPCRQ